MKYDIIPIIQKIDAVSSSFCAAKWKQVTLHLQNGHTHSCHHPRTHQVPLEELAVNPTALHNTNYKKEMRRQMLTGRRPSECSYCWNVEDTVGKTASDRYAKSVDHWAAPHIDDIIAKGAEDNALPSYVEVSFGSVCNFKCSYCAPHISSKLMEEIQQYGPYPTTDGFNNLEWIEYANLTPIPNNAENPYIDAFWQWWPDLYTSLEHFRITGGEPLLNKNTFKVLDYIIANPNPNINISVNTNLCPPTELLSKFIERAKHIVENKLVKSFTIYTSNEAHGAQAEYIRYGLDYQQWLSNIKLLFSEIPDVQITVMSTYNALSVPSYQLFLQDILALKKLASRADKQGKLVLDIPYLHNPKHQAMFILPETFHTTIEQQVDFIRNNQTSPDSKGFNNHELGQMLRVYELFMGNDPNAHTTHRKDFVRFVDEHDRRRQTNFVETFPALADFYHQIKSTL